jgi:hypothetical protein
MPDIASPGASPTLENLTPQELESRLQSIRREALTLAAAKGLPPIEAFRELSTDQLREIAVIAAKLRHLKAAGAPKTPRRREASPTSKAEMLALLDLKS